MRILIFTQHFPPETMATGRRACELAETLAVRRHSVTVISGYPNHPSSVNLSFCHDAPREEVHSTGYRVIRVPVYRSPDTRSVFRLLTYASYFLSAVWRGIRQERPDVILAISPLPTGLAALLVHWWHRVPLVFDLQDIWPDSALAVGVMDSGMSIRALRILEVFFYRRCMLIVVISTGFRNYLVGRRIASETIAIIPNGVHWQSFANIAPQKDFRQSHKLQGNFVVGYIGNIGLAQGLDTVLEAAEDMRDEPVIFLLVGEGTDKLRLLNVVHERHLTNVRLLHGMPRDRVPPILASCDALLLILRNDPLFEVTIPSKLYEYMASGRPILCSVGGEAAEVVTASRCGISVTPSNGTALSRAIRKLQSDPELCCQLGEAGACCARTNFSRDRLLDEYANLLNRAVGESPGSDVK